MIAFYLYSNLFFKFSIVFELVYRGLCIRDPDIFLSMRELYISKEQEIFSIINSYKQNLQEKEFNRVNKYINSFFDILKSDTEFNNKILSKCRG